LDFFTASKLRMSITNSGNVGIGTSATPQQNLSVQGGLNIDQANANSGGISPGLTFGSNSGEGIASNRAANPGLDFYTNWGVRMTINHFGNVSVGGDLTVGAPVNGISYPDSTIPAGYLVVSGNRTYLMGADHAGNHWITIGGITEPDDCALGFNVANKQIVIGGGWSITPEGGVLTVNGIIFPTAGKSGYVTDRFVNTDGLALESGDVVVLHPNASSRFCGAENRIPFVEVHLTDKAQDTCVCGIVDEPVLASAQLRDLDLTKLGNPQIGSMVTLGAYAFCKVDADVAPIVPGDLLTTSPTPGYAQKVKTGARPQVGAVIGKALGGLAEGKGKIPVLVSHH
jgi:hypothetical protein